MHFLYYNFHIILKINIQIGLTIDFCLLVFFKFGYLVAYLHDMKQKKIKIYLITSIQNGRVWKVVQLKK